MVEIGEFIERFGLPLALIIFFLVRDTRREARQESKEKLEADYRNSMQVTINDTLVSLNTKTLEALHGVTVALNGLQHALHTRPCILPVSARIAAEDVMKKESEH